MITPSELLMALIGLTTLHLNSEQLTLDVLFQSVILMVGMSLGREALGHLYVVCTTRLHNWPSYYSLLCNQALGWASVQNIYM